MQREFQGAWKALYPGVLEYVALSDGGLVTAVDVASRTVVTDFDKFTPAVTNIIPQQKAGRIAEIAGVADRTGWCPIDPVTFDSRLQPNIHVIGDAAIGGAMPRSASAANSQARICAGAIITLLAGGTPTEPTLTSLCYSLITPDYAISQRGSYRPVGGIYNESRGDRHNKSRRCAARSARQGSGRGGELVRIPHRRGVRMRATIGVVLIALAVGSDSRAEELVQYRVVDNVIPGSLTGAPGERGTRPLDRAQSRGRAVSVVSFWPVSAGTVPGQSRLGPQRNRRALVRRATAHAHGR